MPLPKAAFYFYLRALFIHKLFFKRVQFPVDDVNLEKHQEKERHVEYPFVIFDMYVMQIHRLTPVCLSLS